MKKIDYRSELHKRLVDKEYAAAYLAEVLANESYSTFLIAVKDVVEAQPLTMNELAKEVGVTRQALHKIMSDSGNPRLSTLNKLLGVIGLQISVTEKPKSEAA